MSVLYSSKAAASVVLEELKFKDPQSFMEHVSQSDMKRWIGERHLAETDRLDVDLYTEKEVRRAVAFARFQSISGAGIGKHAQQIRDRIRDMASWHTEGWIVATGIEDVHHVDDALAIAVMILGPDPFVVVPCTVSSI